jgi:hypothetical protein
MGSQDHATAFRNIPAMLKWYRFSEEDAMTRNEIARLKKILTGPVGKRLEKAGAAQFDLPRRLRNKDSRRAVARALASTLDRSTIRTFTAIAEQDQANLEARLRKIKAEAVRASRGRQQALKAAAAKYLNTVKKATQVPLDSGQIGHELLNVPFMISPRGDAKIEQSHIIANNSFAKFRGRSEDNDDFAGGVAFSFAWTNPKPTTEVINISGFIIFNGHCSLGTGGGIFPADREATVTVDGRLEILEMINNPPTSPPAQPDQFVTALSMHEKTDGWGEVGAVDASDIFRGFALNHSNLIVPPAATLVFNVVASVTLDTGEDDSLAEADFASGGFSVGSPAVLLATLT